MVVAAKEVMYNATKEHQSVGACLQNMLLAVLAQGLVGVWLGDILNQKKEVLRELGLSDAQYELIAVMALGHPDQEGTSQRKPLNELLLEDFE